MTGGSGPALDFETRLAHVAGLEAPEPRSRSLVEIGRSREDRPILACRLGRGATRISLLGGCHADEPVGPRLLARLVSALEALAPDDPLLTELAWWILPHINPDGAARNAGWQGPDDAAYRLSDYLAGVRRELPGDDIEFGFPRGPGDEGARREPAAAAAWWSTAGGPFDLHATLHGMAFAAGPWFLVEPAWVARAGPLMDCCRTRVAELGYRLHDVERQGEKGFHRIAPGFATRPDSTAMREHFLARGDAETSGRFRPSSMEHIRSLGGDPLTLVSEMPLFLLPGVGEELGPPDPAAERWRERIAGWRARLATGEDGAPIDAEAADAGLRTMPVEDQMRLQWTLIATAIDLAREGAASP